MNKYEGDMFIYIEFDTREFAEYFKKPRQLKDDEYFDKNQGYINRFISQEDFEKNYGNYVKIHSRKRRGEDAV